MSEPTTAQRIAEIAARAEAFRQRNVPIGKWAENRWDDASVAAFAESELRAERMECAKAVCAHCRFDKPKIRPGQLYKNNLWHEIKEKTGAHSWEICRAAAIWSLPKGEL